MLKKRINKWSLDKKRKQADMLGALHIALEREAQGKESVFLDRGRLVTFEDIKYYFRRKGIHDLHTLAASPTAAASSTLITCHTPPLTPIAPELIGPDSVSAGCPEQQQLPDGFMGEFNLDVLDFTVPTSPMTFNHIQTIRSNAASLGELEHLLTFNSNYYKAVFDNPRWKEENSSFDINSLELFYHSMYDGQAFLEAGNGTLAFQRFDCAFNFVRDILKQRVLLFLPYVYYMVVQFGNLHNQEVIARLLDFIGRMVETCWSERHPIKCAVSALLRLSPRYRALFAARALQSSLDHLANKIEPVCPDSQLRRTVCPGRYRSVSKDTYQKTAIALRNLISDVGFWNAAMMSRDRTSLVDIPLKK
jgi:hypothetical protein